MEELDSGRPLTLYNTHFGFGDEYQTESAELLKQTVHLAGSENNVIVGDFNCIPDSPAYESLTEDFSDANMLLLGDPGATLHGYGESDGERIDYPFLRGDGLVPIPYKLLDDTFDGKCSSDHYGLMFRIEFGSE